MKYSFILLLITGLLITSCGDSGKEAKTGEAQKVEATGSKDDMPYTFLDPSSHIEWSATHLGGVNKRFGKVQLAGAKALANEKSITQAKAVIDLKTLTVESFPEGSEQKGQLTEHLKSDDFFDVAKFPTAEFELTSVAPGEGGFNSNVTGNLTIKGVTKSITFPANITITPEALTLDSAPFTVDRSDWGLTYHRKGTVGVPVDYLISDDIGFTIHLKLKQGN